jgi:transposase
MVGKLTRVSNKGLTCASHSAAADLTGDAMVVRRRNERWPDAERDRITTESFASGEPIAQVARRNGVSLGLLHYWRRQARAIGAVEELRFVPVTVGEDAVRRTGTLELTIRDVTVRVEGDVEVARLRMVLEAIRA